MIIKLKYEIPAVRRDKQGEDRRGEEIFENLDMKRGEEEYRTAQRNTRQPRERVLKTHRDEKCCIYRDIRDI